MATISQKPDVACILGTQVDPGEYRGYVRVAEHYRDHGFKRWTCILKFDLFDPSFNCVARAIPMWFNLGKGDKPRAGRRSNYFREWLRANSGLAPTRRDRMPPNVFVKRYARVLVSDTESEPPYSVVRQILDWETGERVHINQSINQPINIGRG